VSGVLSPGMKRLKLEADHSSLSNADDKNSGAVSPRLPGVLLN
jgi:hypothetical protein